MKTLQQQLGNYGLYHRSKRNVLTHFFGIPLIVYAVLCLLARIYLAAAPITSLSFTSWLAVSIGVFIFGWVLQFIGHYFEGKKPAFVDDIIGLIIGPLFVLVEALFLLGLYKQLEQQITDIAGPTKP